MAETTHDPALVNRISRALYRHHMSIADTVDKLTDFDALPGSWQEEWHDLAIVALGAMPQPVGYAVAVYPPMPVWTVGGNVYRTLDEVQAATDRVRDGSFPNAGPVALVPIEDTP